MRRSDKLLNQNIRLKKEEKQHLDICRDYVWSLEPQKREIGGINCTEIRNKVESNLSLKTLSTFVFCARVRLVNVLNLYHHISYTLERWNNSIIWNDWANKLRSFKFLVHAVHFYPLTSAGMMEDGCSCEGGTECRNSLRFLVTCDCVSLHRNRCLECFVQD